jgi:hypothetical protein
MKAWLRSDASGNCYSDIPIQLRTHAGKMMNLFASPLSLIIQPTSLPINCSNTPVMFQTKGGDWFSVTERGLHPCQTPLKLAPHSFIWSNMDLGLNWLSPNIYDTKKIKALHHPQNLSTLQKIKHPKTTINQGNKTEDPSFLSGIKKLGNAARGKILEVLFIFADTSNYLHSGPHHSTVYYLPQDGSQPPHIIGSLQEPKIIPFTMQQQCDYNSQANP